jgi:hypothetical protein
MDYLEKELVTKQMTEREYRSLNKKSYSSLKTFADDRKKYYKKYILLEDTSDEDLKNRATLIGSMVDCLLLSPNEFDNKFYISTCNEVPTGLMLQFVEALYKRVRDCVDIEGKLTRPFADLSLEAYNDVKFDRDGNIVAFKRDSFEKVVEKFTENVKAYFDEICQVRPNGLMVITTSDIETAEKVKTELRSNSITSQVINLKSNTRFEVYESYPIIYSYKSFEFKSLLDKLVIDHDEKTIQPYDLKVTWDVENFYEGYFLYRKSYIQVGLYHLGTMLVFKKQEKYKEYKILPMKFIVADPNNYTSPLIYSISESVLMNSFKGFEYKWRNYKGIDALIDDLKWHEETGIWNISKENYENKGVVIIKEEG